MASGINNIPSNLLSQLGNISSLSGAGLNTLPIGGFGPVGQADDFGSLLSSLNSSGNFGPNLYSNTGPAGSNPQSTAIATEGASAATTALLNKIAPLNLPPEALYSSSVYGNLSSGLSWIDTLSSVASGIAGTLPLNGRNAQIAQMISPALGALGGIFGVFQAFKVAFNTPSPIPLSSPEAIEDYQSNNDA